MTEVRGPNDRRTAPGHRFRADVASARKRPANPTLSEDLVSQVKAMTDNLCGVVEPLFAEFVSRGCRDSFEAERVLAS